MAATPARKRNQLHPGITQIGRVEVTTTQIVIAGWTLTYCQNRCTCHNSPKMTIVINDDTVNGRLGLVKYRDCDCCQPWTWQELDAMSRTLAELLRQPI